MDRKDPHPAPTPAAAAASQAGFTLVEVMVTLVVISAGLLGTLKGLYQNLGDLNASYQRTAAVQKAAEMVERLRANRRGAWQATSTAVAAPRPDPAATLAKAATTRPMPSTGCACGKGTWATPWPRARAASRLPKARPSSP